MMVRGAFVKVLVSGTLLFFCSLGMAQNLPTGGAAASDLEPGSDSPLIQAIAVRDEAAARSLVDAGALVNSKDKHGSTPLGVSISQHLPDFVKFLVQRGADVNLTEGRDESPLQLAAFECEIDTAKLLLDHGAKINHADLDGVTPLDYASQGCDNREMIRLLLASGAQVNITDKLGSTSLMDAAFTGNYAAAAELLHAGADPYVKNNKGQTAEDIACSDQLGRKQRRARVCSLLRPSR